MAALGWELPQQIAPCRDAASQVAIYMKLTKRLAAAGADCVAITSIAGHFCIDAFKTSSVLPVAEVLLSHCTGALDGSAPSG